MREQLLHFSAYTYTLWSPNDGESMLLKFVTCACTVKLLIENLSTSSFSEYDEVLRHFRSSATQQTQNCTEFLVDQERTEFVAQFSDFRSRVPQDLLHQGFVRVVMCLTEFCGIRLFNAVLSHGFAHSLLNSGLIFPIHKLS